MDGLNEDKLARHKKGNMSLGTTKKGIGPAYGSKIMRNGECQRQSPASHPMLCATYG